VHSGPSRRPQSAAIDRARVRQTDRPTEAKHRRDSPNKTDNHHSATLLARGHTQINKLNGSDKYTSIDAKQLHTIPAQFAREKIESQPIRSRMLRSSPSLHMCYAETKWPQSLEESEIRRPNRCSERRENEVKCL
jgi:hypothetical protein